ncbi:hypothetical protein PLICRDRAFT_93683 [Plicaturopsis crispa FD-325 SS-3]|nr:hypothetical protein PLICRDRAFT_93683 [Plicaturopsis crispa FD-325 SS-3]
MFCHLDDVLLQILTMLSPRDVLASRMASKRLYALTHDKYLWVTMLHNLMHEQGMPLPAHMKSIEELSSTHLEALTRRLTFSVSIWKRAGETDDPVAMGRVVRNDLPRSVTWLRLVYDRWLLVAASDTVSSSLTCWDLSRLMGGDLRPSTECYLPGPVQSGQIDVDSTRGLVVALGVSMHPNPALYILSLRRRANDLQFVLLAELTGLSYVRCLDGDLAVCALRDDVSIPCLVNWRSNDIWPLSNLPDDEGSCMAAYIHDEHIVIFNSCTIKIYGPLSAPSELPALRQTIRFHNIMWSIALRRQRPWRDVSVGTDQDFLEIIAACEDNVYQYRLRRGPDAGAFELITTDQLDGQPAGMAIMSMPPVGHRGLWAYRALAGSSKDYKLFVCTWRSEQDPEGSYATLDGEDMPALWPPTQVDFDDTLGLLVMGNVIGELAVYDVFERNDDALKQFWGALEVPILDELDGSFSLAVSSVPVPLRTLQIPQDSPLGPFPSAATLRSIVNANSIQLHHSLVPNGWATFDSALENHSFFESSNGWPQWLYEPDSWPWVLEHGYHFLGKVTLYCMGNTTRIHSQMIFSAGGLYFLFDRDEIYKSMNPFCVFLAGSSLEDILEGIDRNQWLPHRRLDGNAYWNVMTDMEEWKNTWMTEIVHTGRNRWEAMVERGGHPPAHLLVPYFTPPFSDTEDSCLKEFTK